MYLISRAPKHTARNGLRQGTASSPEGAGISSSSSAGHSAGMPRFLQRHSGSATMSNVKETAGSNGEIAVSNPSDASEQEADRVADQVMRMPLTQLQRQDADAPGRERKIKVPAQRRAFDQPKADATSAAPVSVDSAGLLARTGAGQSLDSATRAYFEPRFGQDFSQVRVYEGPAAADLARSVNAHAFTMANNIIFAAGAYAPGTQEGQHLLAHELAHVVQQSGVAGADPSGRHGASSVAGTLQRKVKMPAGTSLPTFEKYLKWEGDLYTAEVPDRTQDLDLELFYAIFSSSRIFVLEGKDNDALERSLMRHIRARKGIIAFANAKEYHFEGGRENFKMHDKYWWWDKKTGKFGIKDDADPQEARDDLNVHPGEYYIGCAAATVITMKGGSQSDLIQVSTSDDQDWIPGDGGFIANDTWDGKAPGLEGENIIYMGGKRFWGHFIDEQSIKTFQAWFDFVNGWPEASARLDNKRDYPTAGLK